MSSIKIIAGKLKGRPIPFSNKMFDNADITPQKVKGAIFSIIGERLEGKGFLDLFAGCGQIGIEALSRGANPVVLNENDRKRYNFIKSFLDKLHLAQPPLLLNLNHLEALDLLKSQTIAINYIFLDPPYHKINQGVTHFRQIMEKIGDCGILMRGGEIIIQHYSGNILDDEVGPFHMKTTKRYGKTSLSVFG